jgi:putative glutamine amidotransferase
MPVVGVTAWSPVVPDVPVDLPHQAVAENYLEALQSAGLTPLLIPVNGDPAGAADMLDRLDGVVLTGGGDVAPSVYSATQAPQTANVDPRRDAVESRLVLLARERDVPLLAICRGIQVVNVALGGTLIQDLPAGEPPAGQPPTGEPPRPGHMVTGAWDGHAHPVRLEQGSRLHGLLGAEIIVNSLHHQGIATLAPGLRGVGRAPDGLIEAVEDPDARFLVAVQWHPEMLGPDHVSSALFREFAAAARDTERCTVR